MGNKAETKLVQTPEDIANAYINSSEKHFKKRVVPVFVIAGFFAVDHFIPPGWLTKVEEVAILGYIFEFTRQVYLGVRDSRRAGEAEKLGISTTNAPLTQSP